jgi:hypothetical protein
MRSPAEQETTDVFRVSVKVNDDGLVGGEQAVEGVLGQGVRVDTSLAEDEQVVNINNSDTQTLVAENGGRSDDFEGDLHTASDEDDIGVHAVIGRESSPN